MHVNWFTPLPPDRTAIARFSVSIVEAIAKHHRVTVWVDRLRPDTCVPPGAEPRIYQPNVQAWREINRADCSIFNLGNNRAFHEWIWNASRIVPGVVIVHDPVLQDLFCAINGGPDTYLGFMRRFYGEKGHSVAVALVRGELPILGLAGTYPLTPAALDNAVAAIVHWRGVRTGGRVPARCLPLPFPARNHPPRARPIGAGSPKRLVMLGHLGRNRRVEAVIEALAGFAEPAGVRLDIYGMFEPADALARLIAARGLERHVTHHGFTPADELDAALRDADLVINLREPTMGEVSATQLHAWEHELPTMVSHTGWYATLPPSAAAFVDSTDPDREIQDIRRHIRDLVADPAPFAAMGKAGRAILETHHSIAAYASGLIDLCQDMAALHVGWAEGYLADRVGTLTRNWRHGDDLFPRAAERIFDLFEP